MPETIIIGREDLPEGLRSESRSAQSIFETFCLTRTGVSVRISGYSSRLEDVIETPVQHSNARTKDEVIEALRQLLKKK